MLCGLNAGGFGTGYSDVQSVSGDIIPATWTIINSQASSGNKPHANIVFVQNVTGGSTVQLNVQDSVDGARYVIVELAGTFLTGFLPYDVVDFDGSKYVCITKTDNPPTVSPDDWYVLVDHTFSALTAGTNSQAAMVVGTGASLTYSGTGTVEANELLSTDLRTTGGSHKVLFQTTLGGAITVAQPNFADLAGTIALSQTPLTTLGDLLIVNGTPALARLAGNTTSTKNFLTQTGTGSVSAAPVWGTIATGDLPSGYPWNFLGNATGALTIANGTNATTFNQTWGATWTWANTPAATSGGNDSSPILNLSGTYWNGLPASATDSWTIQDVLGSGTNPTSTLTLTHSGSGGTVNFGLGAAGISATNYSVSPGGTYQHRLWQRLSVAQPCCDQVASGRRRRASEQRADRVYAVAIRRNNIELPGSRRHQHEARRAACGRLRRTPNWTRSTSSRQGQRRNFRRSPVMSLSAARSRTTSARPA